jgi:hypothetical protein
LDVHFDQRYLNIVMSPTTSRETYWALAGIALFIIITACINFINLSTGLALTRAKEVGVRKVLGASRPQLIRQFLGETTMLDENYTRMFGLKMLAGDTISPRPPGDTVMGVAVNETLITKLGFPSPQAAVGQRFLIGRSPVTILGVMQDFQSESKHKKRRPCILFYRDRGVGMASVRIRPQAIRQTLASIEKSWMALYPGDLFQYEFIDDHIAGLYRQEQKVYTAFRFFSFIAILIGCLGLYGLVAFSAVQRTREVGIRKVLGASLGNILYLFSRDFVALILIAFLIAGPVAWLIMHRWLENFAYRIGIGWGTFLLSVAASFLIAGITISYESIKVAIVPPVKSLRTE